MEAQIINLKQWKQEHPPAIVCLNAALAMGLALLCDLVAEWCIWRE